MLMRSLYRAVCRRSQVFSPSSSSAAAAAASQIRHLHLNQRSLPSFSPTRLPAGFQSSFTMRTGSTRHFSEDLSHMPVIKDSDIECAFKDLMAAYWDELPPAVVQDVKKALSKSTDDKSGQEALANVFRAAEAVEEFSGIITSLKMEIDDSIGLRGEDVKPMPDELVRALKTVYQRYAAYLDAFGPEEGYLKKKVENELGSKMIHLKMRCSGLGSEWGKVSVLGTSGLAGSYVEQRA